MVGYNCFIIFQYYYLNIKILKFYENWNCVNYLKILKYWSFFYKFWYPMQILNFLEIFQIVKLLKI